LSIMIVTSDANSSRKGKGEYFFFVNILIGLTVT